MTHDERFDRIEASIERMIERFDKRFEAIDVRFDAMDRRFDSMDSRFDAMDARLTGLNNYVMDFRSEAVVRLGSIESQIRLMAASQEGFEARIPAITKSALENGAAISFLTGRQMDSTASSFELSERVRKLEEKVATILAPAA
jgi:hypothetical protein